MRRLIKMAREEVDRLATERIQKLSIVEVGQSSRAKLGMSIHKAQGHRFLKLHIVSPHDITAKAGIKVYFTGDQKTISLLSDQDKIETDFSESLGVGLTRFDVDLTPELKALMKNGDLKGLFFQWKVSLFQKEKMDFQITNSEYLKKIVRKS